MLPTSTGPQETITSLEVSISNFNHMWGTSWWVCHCVTYFNMSMTGVSSFSIGNFASVFSRRCGSFTVEDLQNTQGVCGFDVVLVRSPDQLVILLPCHIDPLAASVTALQSQGFTQLMADVLQFLDKLYGFWEKQWWNQSQRPLIFTWGGRKDYVTAQYPKESMNIFMRKTRGYVNGGSCMWR